MSLSAPNRWAVLGLVCVAQFMVILDATIVNVWGVGYTLRPSQA